MFALHCSQREGATEHASLIEIEHNATTSWTQKGKTYIYQRYAVTVANKSGKAAHELHIGISKLYGPNYFPLPTGDDDAAGPLSASTTEVEDEPSATPLDEDGIESDPDVMRDDLVEL
ncbi:hypothetical protein EJB05_28035, partial [Eragrostis curvula]